MDVDALFRSYDGRHVEPFREVASSLPRTASNVRMLLDMARDDDERLRFGATWVLKEWVLDGVALDARAVGRLVTCIGDPAMPPMAGVNLLQALPAVPVPKGQASRLLEILVGLVESPVPFLRGWAYNGLDVLACRWPAYRDDVDLLLGQAARDPAASVRARLRNRLKERERERRRGKRR